MEVTDFIMPGLHIAHPPLVLATRPSAALVKQHAWCRADPHHNKVPHIGMGQHEGGVTSLVCGLSGTGRQLEPWGGLKATR